MKISLPACAVLVLAGTAACDSKPSWQPRDVGALSLEFPCKPEESAAVVKCSRSDGTTFSVATVDKEGLAPEQQLAQTKAYVEGMPKSELLEGGSFPLKWREVRTSEAYENWQWYQGGKEYTVRAAYTSATPPPIVAEFFSKVKVK
jgi:hypothetical protein